MDLLLELMKNRYLVLFESEKYDYIYNKIRYLVSLKSGITYGISHNYVKIKFNSFNSLPLEKTMTFHNVIILIKYYICYYIIMYYVLLYY